MRRSGYEFILLFFTVEKTRRIMEKKTMEIMAVLPLGNSCDT